MLDRAVQILSDLVDPPGSQEIEARVERVSRDVNAFGYDRWGFSPEAAKKIVRLAAWLYRRYFRVQAHGIKNVPAGRGVLVGNHSSQLAYDGMLVATAMLIDADPPRAVRAMIEKFFQHVPFANVLMARSGQLTGLPENCRRLLEQDELIMIFPEGARGSGKTYWHRYQLERFGTGFVRLALQTRSPIVPFGFIGGEEICPSFGNLAPLARLLGTPYAPLTPLLLPLPLPAKCAIYFGEPLRFAGTGDEEDHEIEGHVAEVEASVRRLVERGLSERKGIFFG
ncbi:MAG: acyltransferase family protein [Deltaproteobacteria bacterium]|nr:acyltransferase family protein [Deltaproteobacteria bacterium]